jgi:hypothetical protein
MLIQSNLFSKGFMTGQLSLSDLLNGHEREILNKIQRISTLDEMTDSFLSCLIQDSIVEPPVLHLDRMTRQFRTEQFDGSKFPFDFHVQRGKKYPRQVARISIVFSGDSQLLSYTPSQCSLNFPQGQVSGSAVQFDVILWGYLDDDRRVKEQLDQNLRLLAQYADNAAQDVKAFNEALPEKVKAAFGRKLEELTRQHSIFDNLGIKEEVVVAAAPESSTPTAKPKRGLPRGVQIIQFIEHQYVKQLNQTNSNIGDVNNAIQSD